ncbi:hypothetical protein ACFLSJ_06115 [Verrucomicrobiota bacterium]
MARSVEIACAACGAETLLRREPVYEGFRKTGEKLLCASCGHEFASEEEVVFREAEAVRVFGEDDAPAHVDLFEEDEKGRNCRHCRHYVVNPFVQRCGLHMREVAATDFCGDFSPPDPDPDPEPEPEPEEKA